MLCRTVAHSGTIFLFILGAIFSENGSFNSVLQYTVYVPDKIHSQVLLKSIIRIKSRISLEEIRDSSITFEFINRPL